MAFGDRLKEIRELAGYTRIELADKLGITKSAISNYENGVSSPKEDVLLKLFDALNVEPNFLFQDSFSGVDVTRIELDLINKYRLLDERGKKAVIETLEREYSYVLDEQEVSSAEEDASAKNSTAPSCVVRGDEFNADET